MNFYKFVFLIKTFVDLLYLFNQSFFNYLWKLLLKEVSALEHNKWASKYTHEKVTFTRIWKFYDIFLFTIFCFKSHLEITIALCKILIKVQISNECVLNAKNKWLTFFLKVTTCNLCSNACSVIVSINELNIVRKRRKLSLPWKVCWNPCVFFVFKSLIR